MGKGKGVLELVLRILEMKFGDKSGLMNYNVLLYHYAFYLGIVMPCKITLSYNILDMDQPNVYVSIVYIRHRS